MTIRLPSNYKKALEPDVVLRYDKLLDVIADVALEYQHNVGIQFPTINFPLICLRCVKELALPLDVYPTVGRLAALLDYNFMFPDMQLAKYLRKTEVPMAQLAALLVVAAKLLYPFDGKPRTPRRATEPAALTVDWDRWVEIMSEQPKGRMSSKKSLGFADVPCRYPSAASGSLGHSFRGYRRAKGARR